MELQRLLGDISYRLAGNCPNDPLSCEITRVTANCGEADAETLYVCLRNALFDGYEAAATAYERGCHFFLTDEKLRLPDDAAVFFVRDAKALLYRLAARLAGDPARHMRIYGVAGGVGKSSVAFLLHTIFRRSGSCAAVIGKEGVLTGETYTRFGNITPDGAKIAACLKDLADRGVSHVILEITPYMLRQKSLSGVPFAAIVVTGLAIMNGSLEDRETMLSFLRETAVPLVLPASACDVLSREGCFTFGDGGELFADEIEPSVEKGGYGMRFRLKWEREDLPVSLLTPSRFAVENALAAVALARTAGVAVRDAADAISGVAVWGTLECVAVVGRRYIYRDVAYTPEALRRALKNLRAVTPEKLTLLIGSVGGRVHERRAALAKVAEEEADLTYLTADDPDCESPLAIAREMEAAFADPSRAVVIPDRREAILRAVFEMRPGDTLLLAGKARENAQFIAGRYEPFDEVSIVKTAAARF